MLVPDEIRRYVPVEISASGLPVIQWEKDQTEDAGLVKIDLLGNRSLAVIRDALAAIASNTGRLIDYATWDPISDPAAQELIRQGDTMGCFYVESPATRLLLKKLWGGMPSDRRALADVFEYLVVVSSLIRPRPIPSRKSLCDVRMDTNTARLIQCSMTFSPRPMASWSIRKMS